MKTYVTVYFGTALVAMFLVPIISRLAKRYRFVDSPGPRKVHRTPIPHIGGIVFIVSTLSLILPLFFLNNDIGRSFREARTEFIALLAGASFIFVVGLIDDLRTVRPNIKLLCIVGASLVVCASGATIRSISFGPWFELEFGWLAWPLAVIWITTITIGMNFIDGLDGLAGGIAAIVCGTILVLALWSSQTAIAVLMLALLGSVTGFLFFNFHPAKIFMGDSGSMFLGFMIGAGSLVCQAKTCTLVGLALPFLALGVPIFDMAYAVIRRHFFERRSLFTPDRSHLHHHLLDLGLRQGAVVIIIYSMTAISASIGLFMLTVGAGWSGCLFAIGLLLLFSMFVYLYRDYYHKIRLALKRNRIITREAREIKRSFENAQVRMLESRSFKAWWETVCDMGQKMHFHSIGLWHNRNGCSVNVREWKASKSTKEKLLKIIFTLNGRDTTEWEMRVKILINSYLELSARQAMLLARLMDEFPPPEEESEEFEQSKDADSADIQIKKMPDYVPMPLSIIGIPVVPFELYSQSLECIEKLIDSNKKSFCVAINPVKIYHALQKPELLKILQQADIGICDGVGISITSRILNGKSIKRCTGCDLFFKLLSLASRKGWGVYMLGASAQSNAKARLKLKKMYPNLKILGWQNGYFKNSDAVIKQINSSKAKLLFVAMGSPKQEYWIWQHRQAINANFCMGVGGSFDIASGSLQRAPRFFRVTGTEFLFRLMMEPFKRWHIQKVLFPYLFRVIEKKLVDFTISTEDRKD